MSELLPCPFCNCLHAPSVHTDERGFFVWCDTNYGGCGSRGAVASTNKGAIIVWNHRAPATTANGGAVTVMSHTGPLPSPSPDIIPPLAQPADPALLALARLGAEVAHWVANDPSGDVETEYLDLTGVMDDGRRWYQPGIADAIAALLADGAASEGVADA